MGKTEKIALEVAHHIKIAPAMPESSSGSSSKLDQGEFSFYLLFIISILNPVIHVSLL